MKNSGRSHFPLIEDIRMEVANKYGMIQPGQSNTQAVRAVFVIDPKGASIRTILYYPLSTGRNFDELKRIVLALQKADSDQVATPADWRPGQDVIVPPAGSCGTAKERMEGKDEDITCLDWFPLLQEGQGLIGSQHLRRGRKALSSDFRQTKSKGVFQGTVLWAIRNRIARLCRARQRPQSKHSTHFRWPGTLFPSENAVLLKRQSVRRHFVDSLRRAKSPLLFFAARPASQISCMHSANYAILNMTK